MRMTTVQSLDPDASAAGRDLIEQANGVTEATLAMLYVPPALDGDSIVRAIATRWPTTPVIGCTATAVISSHEGTKEEGTELVLLHDTHARAYTQLIRTGEQDTEATIRAACSGLTVHDPARTVGLAFSPAVAVSGDQVIRALSQATHCQVPIVGGLADTSLGTGAPRLFYYDGAGGAAGAYDDAVIFALLAPVQRAYGIGGGWRAVSHQSTVTSAEGHIVYTIDDEPALTWYQRYVLPVHGSFAYHPLVIEASPGHPDTDWILRAPVAIDEQTGAVTFAGDVPIGSRVSLATVRRQYLVDGVKESVDALTNCHDSGAADALIAVSCNTRAGVLGTRADYEWQTVQQRLGGDVPVAGAYVNGELAPIGYSADGGWRSRLYNQTIVTLALTEASGSGNT